jgi:hypothetical protein
MLCNPRNIATRLHFKGVMDVQVQAVRTNPSLHNFDLSSLLYAFSKLRFARRSNHGGEKDVQYFDSKTLRAWRATNPRVQDVQK